MENTQEGKNDTILPVNFSPQTSVSYFIILFSLFIIIVIIGIIIMAIVVVDNDFGFSNSCSESLTLAVVNEP